MVFNTKIENIPAAGRFSLRCKEQNVAALSQALGLALPAKISEQSEAGGRSLLKLGPDEWVLTCSTQDKPTIKDTLAAVYPNAPHSLTDISSREVSIRISGDQAEELLSTSCPRNLSQLTPGRGIRTIFDSVQVILTREAENQFRLDIWRSFFPHVHGLLKAASLEFESGV